MEKTRSFVECLTLTRLLAFTTIFAVTNCYSATGFYGRYNEEKPQLQSYEVYNGNGENNNAPRSQPNVRRHADDEWFVFDSSRPQKHGHIPYPTIAPVVSTQPPPGSATRRSFCERLCRVTPQYNPVCGTDRMTYTNEATFRCAQDCGKRIQMLHMGACAMVDNFRRRNN